MAYVLREFHSPQILLSAMYIKFTSFHSIPSPIAWLLISKYYVVNSSSMQNQFYNN
jgi:hypothetical protein